MINQEKALEDLQRTWEELDLGERPAELYEPIRYIMSLGGKRMRPLLALIGCSLYRDDYKPALLPALAVEVFHNFTLMHDDIMDNAPLRRGKATVHEKWNANIAILSGDTMFVKSYDLLLATPPALLPRVIALFNRTAIEVCEGQQWDMNFERLDSVSIPEYLEMIRLKTAVLLGLSLRMGALIGGASEEQADLLRQFGEAMGIGFQLKDDLLDVYGDQAKFGKQVGGDIIANKKTYLLIRALADANTQQAAVLNQWLSTTNFDPAEKVEAVKGIYDQLAIADKTKGLINEYFEQAFALLDRLQVEFAKKQWLIGFGKKLAEREQ